MRKDSCKTDNTKESSSVTRSNNEKTTSPNFKNQNLNLIHQEVEENKEEDEEDEDDEGDNSGIMNPEGFQRQIERGPQVERNGREALSTGKKKTSGKGAMLKEVEDWYQYIPTFKKHIKRGKKVPGSVRKPTSNILKLLKSPFPQRPETLFFNYPKYVGQNKLGAESDRLKTVNQEQMINHPMIFKIADGTNIYNSLVNSCKTNGMILIDEGDDWNLLWAGFGSTDTLKEMD